MGRYFEYFYRGEEFKLFSLPHIIVILVIVFLNIFIFIKRSSLRSYKYDKTARYIISALLLLQEVSLNIWYIYSGEWSISYSLPLHLCGASVILCSIMLLTNSYKIYEVAYFWGLGGAVQAILTPDLGSYGYPHYRFFQFFVSHGLIVTACIYMTFVKEHRPALKSVFKAFYSLNIYTVIIGIFNYFTNSNYLFICEKPQGKSILDLLGSWPYYIAFLEVIGFVLFFLLYIPFKLKKIDESCKMVDVRKNKLDI